MKTNHVCIIEIELNGKFVPTVGCFLNRDSARNGLLGWKRDCPDDKFKIVQYVPSDK